MGSISKPIVFISHRSVEKGIADMLIDFLIGTGISREYLFCSSLPGNDVNERINTEVKDKLKNSSINIAILSDDYYKSAYCLNEAGVMWFCDKIRLIPIVLPEISSENMYGFLNNEYKIRRLNSNDDISYIYDAVCTNVDAQQCKASIVTAETAKLKKRYETYTSKRSITETSKQIVAQDTFEILSDDEAIVMYYILTKKVRKIKKNDINSWMIDEELFDINIDNAFDLLSNLENGKHEEGILELDINVFRKNIGKSEELVSQLFKYVEKHRKLSSDTFEKIWQLGKFEEAEKLFVSYIIDERITTFGDRWMAEEQIEDIGKWAYKNGLDSTLSEKYGSCLSMFIEKNLVYESSWTSYGNPREYSLHVSLKEDLFSSNFKYSDELLTLKEKHPIDLPF